MLDEKIKKDLEILAAEVFEFLALCTYRALVNA
jgi:hypothetical protein